MWRRRADLMKLYDYTKQHVEAGECPFRGDFANNLWIAYHGTSSHAEAFIDSNGFSWQEDTYSKADVYSVLEVFELLHWAGSRGDGFPVLASFTLNDFNRGSSNNIKPIYFGETSYRSLLYAQRDWSGGETARALRHCFNDLDKFLSSETFRREQMWESWKNLREFFKGDVPENCAAQSPADITFSQIRSLWKYYEKKGSTRITAGMLRGFHSGLEPANFTEDWLRDKLKSLKLLRQRCESMLDTYEYGIVYAVQFAEEDCPHLAFENGGLVVNMHIPPERIVGKSRISPECLNLSFDTKKALGLMRVMNGDGVVTRANKKQVIA